VATAALFVVVADGLVWVVAAAPFVSRHTSGFGFDLGHVLLGTPPSALGALGVFLLGRVPFRLFPRALRPSLGATSLFFLLAPRLVLFLLSPAPLAASFVFGAAGLLCDSFCSGTLRGFLFGATSTAGGAASFPLGIFLFSPPPRLVICRGVCATAAGGFRAGLRARLFLWIEDAAKERPKGRGFLGGGVGALHGRARGRRVCHVDHDDVIVSLVLLERNTVSFCVLGFGYFVPCELDLP
jgi:hypothetical protein